jgi:hypothetical protein
MFTLVVTSNHTRAPRCGNTEVHAEALHFALIINGTHTLCCQGNHQYNGTGLVRFYCKADTFKLCIRKDETLFYNLRV